MTDHDNITGSTVVENKNVAHEDILLSCLTDALVRQDEILETLRECDPNVVKPLMPGQYVSGEIMESLAWHHRLEHVPMEGSTIVPLGASGWVSVDVKSHGEETVTMLEVGFPGPTKVSEIRIAVNNVFQDVDDHPCRHANEGCLKAGIRLRTKATCIGFGRAITDRVIIFIETS